MHIMPITGKERIRIACLVDDIDRVIFAVRYLFAGNIRCKVVVHNLVAIVCGY